MTRGRRLASRTVALTALLAVGAAAAHAAPAHPGKTRTVGVVSDYFDPDAITIHQGDRIKYVWKGGGLSGHDVNVDSGPEQFHSPTQYAGTFVHTFKKTGTYKLYCTQHEDMVQTVKVKKRR
ncbi:MAG TPA: cupredoxin domain-containing protein [Baekduia sp.]|nr:cupredoxin domain-containing protein [Baekduia sp.]